MVDKYRVKVFFKNGIVKEFISDELTIEPNDGLYLYKDGVLIYEIPVHNIWYYELNQEEFPSPEAEEEEEENISQSFSFDDWWERQE